MEKKSEKIIALLGPTNTGKTYIAIEKMLKHKTGIFGLPLDFLPVRFMINVFIKLGLRKLL